MNKLLATLAALLVAATGCAAPPAVNDVKVTQAAKVSPPTWDFHTFSPVANSLWGFDSSVLPVNVTLGSGLALNATTHVLTAGVGSYQPLNTNLTSISGLANGAGWLRNDGAGVFTYSTPTPTQIGASTVGANFFGLTNPSAITFPRINADNTVSALDAATFRSAIGAGTGNGSVTAVSVASTNGFTGNSSGGTTPVLTLATSVTGLIKGNGTAMSPAGVATDYVAPSAYASANGLTLATARLLGRATAGSGAAEEITLGAGVTFVGNALTVTGSGGGTVTNTGGVLTNNAVVLGAGGNDTKVVAGFSTNGSNQMTIGNSILVGSGSGNPFIVLQGGGLGTAGSQIGFSAGSASATIGNDGAVTGASNNDFAIQSTANTRFYSGASYVGGFTPTGFNVPGFLTHGGMKRMTSDVVVSASTTLTDLTGLSVALAVGQTYSFRASILTTHSGTGGYKIDLHASGGLTATSLQARVKGFFGSVASTANAAYVSTISALDGGGASMVVTGGGNGEIEISGTITVNAGGTLTIQGAQQSASSSSTYQAGSFMEVLKY